MMIDPVIPDYEMGAPFDVNDKTVTDKRERHVVIEIERILFFGFFRRFKVHDERVAGIAFRREDVVAGKSVVSWLPKI